MQPTRFITPDPKHPRRPAAAMHRLGAAALLAVAAPAMATDFVVTTRDDVVADDGQLSLREAVMAASTNEAVGDAPAGSADGDTISFDLGVELLEPLERTITLSEGPLMVADDVVIDGTLAAEPLTSLTLSGGGASQIFVIDTASAAGDSGAVVISGMRLTAGASAVNGGAIEIAAGSEVSLDAVAIDGSTAGGSAAGEGGGAIFNAGTLSVDGGSISGNAAEGTAGSGGGILNAEGATLTVTGTSFSNNSASRAGGGIEASAGSTTTLDGVTMNANSTGPAPGNGGALHITGDGNATISGGSFTANTAANEGGALWNGAGEMTVSAATISNNTASGEAAAAGGGGVFNNGGSVTLSDVTISGNAADGAGGDGASSGSGGGVLNKGTLTVTGGSISGNTAIRAGGGIEATAGSTTTLDGVSLSANSTGPTPGNGGGLHITGDGNATISGGSVSDNTAANEGGGLWNGAGTMTVTAALISGNAAEGAELGNGGGGLFNLAGSLQLDAVTVSGNSAPNGAGSGGGILNRGAELRVSGGEISGNNASRAGGGIEDNPGEGISSTVTLTDLTLSANVTGPNPGNGGAFHNTGAASTVLVRGVTAEGNEAANEGGGLWNFGGATMDLANSTVTGNTAGGTGGGGLFNQPDGEMVLRNVTVAFNGTAGDGGGLLNSADGSVAATNALFGSNGADGSGPQISGSVSADFSLVSDTEGATISGDNNQLDAMAGLQPLAANGGPTQTHAIDSGSPAFANGDGDSCQAEPVAGIDQRGVARKQPDCDIGAFEAVDGPQAMASSTVDDGDVQVMPGDEDVVLLGVALQNLGDAEALEVNGLSGGLDATGDAELRFINARVVIDANGNGVLDAGEAVLSQDAGAVALQIGSGRFTVSFSPERLIAPGESEAYLVIVDIAPDTETASGFALLIAGSGLPLLAFGLVGGLRRRHALLLAALLATAGLAGCGDSSRGDRDTSLQATLTNVDAAGAVSGDPAEGLDLPIEGPRLVVDEDSSTP